ncbi:MAG: GntR family transcriptional regulator [Algicola sp.]|nr:GntR family transcriptional regulator [Algicola sp.]
MKKTTALAISITTGDARPVFRQIVDQIREQIGKGNLPPDSKLPSVRALAMQLGINPNTVSRSYSELTAQGLLGARRGLGVFVLEPQQQLSDDAQQQKLEEATKGFVNEVMYLDFNPQQIADHVLAELNKIKNR